MDNILFNKLFTEVFTEQDHDLFFEVISLVEAVNPQVIVEIGVKEGGTLNFWKHIVPTTGLVVGIDTGNTVKWCLNCAPHVKFIEGDSLNISTYRKFQQELQGRPVDFLFIDGGHEYREAKSDFYTYGWHVRKGGLIALHDINLDSVGEERGAVKHFWQEIKDRSGSFYDILFEDDRHTGMGIVRIRE